MSEKEDLQNTVNNLNGLIASLNKKYQEREQKLLQEIETLKEYAAQHTEERFHSLEEENRR